MPTVPTCSQLLSFKAEPLHAAISFVHPVCAAKPHSLTDRLCSCLCVDTHVFASLGMLCLILSVCAKLVGDAAHEKQLKHITHTMQFDACVYLFPCLLYCPFLCPLFCLSLSLSSCVFARLCFCLKSQSILFLSVLSPVFSPSILFVWLNAPPCLYLPAALSLSIFSLCPGWRVMFTEEVNEMLDNKCYFWGLHLLQHIACFHQCVDSRIGGRRTWEKKKMRRRQAEEWGRGGKCLCIGSQPMHVLFFQRRDVKRMSLSLWLRRLQGHTTHLFLKWHGHVCEGVLVVSSIVRIWHLFFCICFCMLHSSHTNRQRNVLNISLVKEPCGLLECDFIKERVFHKVFNF